MKIKKLLFALILFLFVFTCINSTFAVTDDNMTCNLSDDKLIVYNDDALLKDSQTIVVDDFGESHREMNNHTIRNAIQSANDGDTIVINGQNYDHVHIVIDKQLTIKSNVGTNLRHCSNQGIADSGHQGIFYITSK